MTPPRKPTLWAVTNHNTEEMVPVKITHASLMLVALLFINPAFANQWVAVDCEGQARALLSQVSADPELALADDQAERLRAISIAVCEGDTTAQSESGKKKKKGFFDSLSFGEEGEKKEKKEKKGNERLNKF